MKFDVTLTLRPSSGSDETITATAVDGASIAGLMTALSDFIGTWPPFLPAVVGVSILLTQTPPAISTSRSLGPR